MGVFADRCCNGSSLIIVWVLHTFFIPLSLEHVYILYTYIMHIYSIRLTLFSSPVTELHSQRVSVSCTCMPYSLHFNDIHGTVSKQNRSEIQAMPVAMLQWIHFWGQVLDGVDMQSVFISSAVWCSSTNYPWNLKWWEGKCTFGLVQVASYKCGWRIDSY